MHKFLMKLEFFSHIAKSLLILIYQGVYPLCTLLKMYIMGKYAQQSSEIKMSKKKRFSFWKNHLRISFFCRNNETRKMYKSYKVSSEKM